MLITRAAQQAAEFAGALAQHGAEPIVAPTITFAPPDDPLPAHRAIDALASYAWVVFTSQNAVDVFFDRLRTLDVDARYIGVTKVAAIGSKTAERLGTYGIRPDLLPVAFIGEEIARALIEASHHGDRILIFRAQEGRDVLPQMLRNADRIVDVVAAYKTVLVRDEAFAEKVERADALTFTSASTVRGFAAMFADREAAARAAGGKMIACVGPVTAEAARELGLRVDVVADVFTTDGLIDALAANFAQRA